MRCRDGALPEPLAGTAPLARWWWLIEVPGPWGPKAVEDCRVAAVRSLPSTDERRVLLIRRRGRHPAADPDAPLRVWFAGALPGDPPPRRAEVVDHTQLHAWPAHGPPPEDAVIDPHAPVLAVCANSARDLCCGLDGRELVRALDDDRVWECSHLGGHRFAPTALLVGEGLVYGRLPVEAARSLVDRGPTADTAEFLRGRSASAPAAQAAEAALMARGHLPDPSSVDVDDEVDGTVLVRFAGMAPLEVQRVPGGAPRPVSCGGTPESWSVWRV
jgi:hypothetical protein